LGFSRSAWVAWIVGAAWLLLLDGDSRNRLVAEGGMNADMRAVLRYNMLEEYVELQRRAESGSSIADGPK